MLALLALLHAFADLRLLVPLEERVVQLLGGFVVARQVGELLLALWRVVDPDLIGGEVPLQALLLGLEEAELGARRLDGLLKPDRLRVERHLLYRFLGLRQGQLALEAADLVLQSNDVRPEIGVLDPQRGKLPLEPLEPDLVGLEAGLGAYQRELVRQHVEALREANLVLMVRAKLPVHRLHAGDVRLRLLGHLADIAGPEPADLLLLLVQPSLGLGELHPQELARRLAEPLGRARRRVEPAAVLGADRI